MVETETLEALELKAEQMKQRVVGLNVLLQDKVVEFEKTIKTVIEPVIPKVENREIRIHVDSESVYVRYVYDIKKHGTIDINIKVANKRDIFDFYDVRIPTAKDIQIGDVFRIETSGVNIDMLKNGEIHDFDYIVLCAYVAQEFRSKGHLVKLISEFYKEFLVSKKEIDDLGYKLYELNDIIKKKMLENFKNEIIKQDYFKKDTILIIRQKKRNFEHFTAYHFETVGHKYLHMRIFNAQTDYHSGMGLYYMKIKNPDDDKRTYEAFVHYLATQLYDGNTIEVFTKAEWDDLTMLMRNEKENIIESGKDNGFYHEKSKYYEEIYRDKYSMK